ncbi:MAG: hypothetical protein GEV08_09940 [Acidimicrobiia bacterium]|nr:hypothetical protein [Acidimicrobiia bacterium]
MGGSAVEVPVDAEGLTLPIPPLLVSGTVTEWEKVLDRELGDIVALEDAPAYPTSARWAGHEGELGLGPRRPEADQLVLVAEALAAERVGVGRRG